jgi:hypothetical protein
LAQTRTKQINPASTQLLFFSGEDILLARQAMPDLNEKLRMMHVHGRHTVYLIDITKKLIPDKDMRRIGTRCYFYSSDILPICTLKQVRLTMLKPDESNLIGQIFWVMQHRH